MKVCVLTSGSKGNSTYVETGDTKFLIDAGVNMKYISEKLKCINESLDNIDFIIISHPHSDHISALESILKKYNIKTYITKAMIDEMPFVLKYECDLSFDEEIKIGNTVIKCIPTSHDASDSRGFYIFDNISSLVSITDTGYIKAKYLDELSNKNMYIIESNYNVEKLRHSSYPIWLQARISSPVGHLSNEMSSSYLVRLIGKDTKKVVLAHISEENNTEEIAMNTLKDNLNQYGIIFTDIECAHQRNMLEMIEI